MREHTTGLIASTITFSCVDGPGNRFVVFLQGCNFDCVACHNPQTIPGHAFDPDHLPTRRSVADVVADIRRAAPFVRGITVSGGEATQQPGFLHALFTAIRFDPATARLTCFVDSNGACDPSTWAALAPVTDGVMIDLKCLDDTIHRQMTGQSNEQVLASIRQLHGLGLLYEVRLLLLAGVNDGPALLQRTGRWLAAIDPQMRVKIIGFRAHGARPHDPPLAEPGLERIQAAAQLLAAVGPFQLVTV